MKSMRIVNFLGGALFAFGLLNFIESSFQQWSKYTVSELGTIQREPNGADGSGATIDLSDFLNDEQHKAFNNRKRMFLVSAVIGAGLACLRESKRY